MIGMSSMYSFIPLFIHFHSSFIHLPYRHLATHQLTYPIFFVHTYLSSHPSNHLLTQCHIQLFTHSSINSFIQSSIHSIFSFTITPLNRRLIHSTSSTHALIHQSIHFPINSSIHPPNNSFIYSSIRFQIPHLLLRR